MQRPEEQNKGPGYESMQLHPPNFWQRCQEHMMEKRQPTQQMLLGKVVIYLEKIETRSMASTQSGKHWQIKLLHNKRNGL
jgi:hypothetical protein